MIAELPETVAPQETNFAAIPYRENKALLPSDILARCYLRMVNEGLLDTVFHERPFSDMEFLKFATGADVQFLIFADLASNEYAGFAWVTEIAKTNTMLRGWGGFAFFREFWNPFITHEYGKIALRLWFEGYKFDKIFGLTPETNRLSRAYCARMGFRYTGRIPGYTCYEGKTVDAMICSMTREEWEASGG